VSYTIANLSLAFVPALDITQIAQTRDECGQIGIGGGRTEEKHAEPCDFARLLLRGPGRQRRGQRVRERVHDAVVEGEAERLDGRGGSLAADEREAGVSLTDTREFLAPVAVRRGVRAAVKPPQPLDSRWSPGGRT